MRIDILTVVPELLESPLSHSIVGRAIKKGLVEIHIQNLRQYGKGPRLQVDDYSYGGDAGMVLMVEPVFKMIEELKTGKYQYARINLANGDMVGHTGNFLAAKIAVETVDLCLSRLLPVIDELGGISSWLDARGKHNAEGRDRNVAT